MTKAERIYRATRYECKKHISNWGYKENVGFNAVIYNDNETVCKRTLNEMRKHLERARKHLALDIKLGILTSEAATFEEQILNMVEKTIENTVR